MESLNKTEDNQENQELTETDKEIPSNDLPTTPMERESDISGSGLASKTIFIYNIIDKDMPTTELNEIETDIRSECTKFGTIDKVLCQPLLGQIMVKFSVLDDAVKCLKGINGRLFDGKTLKAQFDSSTAEEVEDDQIKVDAFLASLM